MRNLIGVPNNCLGECTSQVTSREHYRDFRFMATLNTIYLNIIGSNYGFEF